MKKAIQQLIQKYRYYLLILSGIYLILYVLFLIISPIMTILVLLAYAIGIVIPMKRVSDYNDTFRKLGVPLVLLTLLLIQQLAIPIAIGVDGMSFGSFLGNNILVFFVGAFVFFVGAYARRKRIQEMNRVLYFFLTGVLVKDADLRQLVFFPIVLFLVFLLYIESAYMSNLFGG